MRPNRKCFHASIFEYWEHRSRFSQLVLVIDFPCIPVLARGVRKLRCPLLHTSSVLGQEFRFLFLCLFQLNRYKQYLLLLRFIDCCEIRKSSIFNFRVSGCSQVVLLLAYIIHFVWYDCNLDGLLYLFGIDLILKNGLSFSL